MAPTLKAEFKKLLTVRSTYFISIIMLLLISFVAFYAIGYKASPTDLVSPLFLVSTIGGIAAGIAPAAGIVALLLLAHEYRYNTIVYTLTAANKRSKVLLSKICVSMVFVLVYTIVVVAIALALVGIGVAATGHHLPHQDINYLTFFGKSIFYTEAYALAALLFITLIRNQIGAIALLLLMPGTIETLLSLLLKRNSIYLPFTALTQVIKAPLADTQSRKLVDVGHLSPVKGGAVFLAYLIVGWIVAWYLFLKRDAA